MTKKTKAVKPQDMTEQIGFPADPRIITSSVSSMFKTYEAEERRVDVLKIADYRRMRDNDGQVQMLISSIKNTIFSVGFDILDDPDWEDKQKPSEEKIFIEKNLTSPYWKGGMYTDITSVNSIILRALEEGFMPLEIVYREEDGKLLLDKILPRTTAGEMTDFKMLVGTRGEFLGVNQRLTVAGQYKDVIIANDTDIHKIINVVWGAEYGSAFGRSALKPIWYHYDKGHKGMYLNHVGHEFGAVKFRHLKKKGGTKVNAGSDEAMLANLDRIGLSSSIIVPQDQYELTFEDASDADVMRVGKEMIDYHTTQMAKAWLAQFIELGVSSNSGSRALAGDSINFFKAGLQGVATTLLENTWNILIADAIKLNFNRGIYPRLKWRPMEDETVQVIYELLKEMAGKDQLGDQMKAEILGKASDKLNLDVAEEDILSEMQANKTEKVAQEKIAAATQTKPVTLAEYDSEPSETAIVERTLRPLYRDEEKVRLADIARKMDDVRWRSENLLREKLSYQRDAIVNGYIEAMRSGRGSIKKVEIELADQNKYSDELLALFYELVEAGKIFAANELLTGIPTTSQADRNWIKDKIDSIIEEQESRLRFRLQDIAMNGLVRKQAENTVKLMIEQEYDRFFESIIPPTLNANIPLAMNYGRNISFSKNRESIFAYRYTAVLDSRTTEYCRDLDGRVFQESDPDFIMLSPPNHFGCRSVWTPITKKEVAEFPVDVNGKPTNIQAYGSLNTFRDIQNSEETTKQILELL